MEDRAARRREEARARRRRAQRRRRIALGSGAGALVLMAGAALLLGQDGAGAPAAVRVAGVPVDGMDRKEVARVVSRRADELLDRPLVIESDEPGSRFRFQATRRGLGARPQARRAVEAALHERGFVGRVMARLGATSTREVPLAFTLDPERVDALAGRVTDELNVAPVSARLRLGGGDIVLTPGRPGRGVDPEALRARIRALPERIVVRRERLQPPVDDAEAVAAREVARRVIDGPVEVTFQGRGVPLAPAVLRSALRFRERPPGLAVALDPDVLHEPLTAPFEGRERAARDADFRIAGDRVRVTSSQTGRRLHMARIAAAIVRRPDAPQVPARFAVIPPGRTTAQARALRISREVGEFSTGYPCCEPRVTNIRRAAELLDGTIVPAGGRFSLNEALGERTLARGFVEAPQIAAGRLEDAVGGGVSQMATTVYNAAFFAGMGLEAHTPHQFYISRYPAGREATVSYGGPELVFVNDWDAAVLMRVEAGDTAVRVRMFSSPLGRRVETRSGEPHDYVEPQVRERLDPDLPAGSRVVTQDQGGPGFTISYTRTVYAGARIKRDERFDWTYDPQDAFVDLGPPKPKPKPAPKPERRAPEPTTPDEPPTGTGTGPGAETAPPADPAAPSTGTMTAPGPPVPGLPLPPAPGGVGGPS